MLDLAAAGWVESADMLALIDGGPEALGRVRTRLEAEPPDGDHWMPLSEVTLLAPIPRMRRNLFCVGRNYKLHIEEAARTRGIEPVFPVVPEFFTKPVTAVIGHEHGIERHEGLTEKLDYEAELGVVVGRRCRDLTPETAAAAIFGYTIVNDVSARDLQSAHGQWFKGKGLDTFCPVGPSIVTTEEFGDPASHRISLRVNGELRQDSVTGDMLFSVPQILAHLSAGLTLEPGDIIATGTPSGVIFGMPGQAYLQVGDVVEVEISGIGVLRNAVVGRARVGAVG